MADIRNQMEQQSLANTQLTITVHNLAQTVQALALSVEDIRQGLQRLPQHPIQQGQSSQFPPPSNSSPGIPPPSHRSPGMSNTQVPSQHINGLRLELPKFNGIDPYGWLFKINEYYEFYGISDIYRVQIASFAMEDDASEWYRWLKTNQLLGTWEDFMDKIKLRFGPSQLVDYQGQLSKLTQTSTVADYRASFERLLNKVSGISEPVLISMFIAGLKHELQQDLLLAKPTSLEEAFSLAKTYESKYELLLSTPKWASRPTAVSIPHRPYSNHQPPIRPTTVTMPQPPQRPSPTATTGRPIPDLPVRRLSAAEIRDKRSKGLCYNCDKKWSNSHRCQSRFLMLLGMEEDDQVCQEEVTPQDDQFTEAMLITADISTLNSLSGMNTPSQRIQILVDGGSTHNFIQPSVAEKLHLPTTTIEKFNVYIGNGDSLHCRVRCPQVPIQMQGTIFPIDLFVLPIQGPDVVLGVQWLQQLGKITHDYAQLSMEFLWNGQPICLKGDHARSLQQITFNQLQAITESKNVEELYELFYIASTKNEELPDTTLSMEFELPQGIPNEAAELILSFSTIFQPPRDLPPHRDLDHRIHLLPGSKPVNVRPYRYPHFKKSEIEKLNFPTKISTKATCTSVAYPQGQLRHGYQLPRNGGMTLKRMINKWLSTWTSWKKSDSEESRVLVADQDFLYSSAIEDNESVFLVGGLRVSFLKVNFK
nr:Transposon Ty3-G Gag-Pol polyprotein [Ipomoea batatas]